jgi:hypothetical protein
MPFEKSRTWNHAFVLTEEDVNSLHKIIGEFLGSNPTLTVKMNCADDSTRTLRTVSEIRAYENPPEAMIHTVKIAGSSADTKRSLEFFIGQSFIYGMITVTIKTENQEAPVTRCFDQIAQLVRHMCPAYSSFTYAQSHFIVLGVFMLMFLMPTCITLLVPVMSVNGGTVLLFILAEFACASILALVLIQIKTRLFPKAMFALGYGVKRNNSLHFWRVGVITAVVLNIIASIVYGVAVMWV